MNNQQPPIQQQFNVDISQLENMKCDCGNNIFIKFAQLKHISAFFTPLGKDTGVCIDRYVCVNPFCGLIYAGAMAQAEIKKYARGDSPSRFDWVPFFQAGFQLMAKLAHEKGAEGIVKDAE